MNRLDIRHLGIAVCVLVAGLLAVALSGPSASTPTDAPPSYESLRALYDDGTGKGLDEGLAELLQFNLEQPTGWAWVIDDIRDGDGEVYLIKTPEFVPPEPGSPETHPAYRWVEEADTSSIEALVLWIVMTYPHVTDPAELQIDHIVKPAN